MFVVSLIGSFLLIKHVKHSCECWHLFVNKKYYDQISMEDRTEARKRPPPS